MMPAAIRPVMPPVRHGSAGGLVRPQARQQSDDLHRVHHDPSNVAPSVDPRSEMHAESVEYQHAGRRYVGHLALPEGDDIRASVLVCHEGPGLDEHAKQRAERLADLGYVAFALDYHGDGQPLDMSEVRSRLTPMMESPELTRTLGRAGLDVLLAHRRTDP